MDRGLKVNGNINFSCLLTVYVLCIFRLKLKTECQEISKKLRRKVTKLNSKFSQILSWLNRALNNPTLITNY